MPELFSLPDQEHTELLSMLPPWMILVLAVFVFLGYLLPRIAEASEAVARLMGPLGRYWRKRGLRRAERHRDDVQSEARQLAKQIVAEVTPADYQEMGRRLTNMDDRVKALERANQAYQAYIVYDAEWHFDDELAAVGRPDCKPADRLNYDRFADLYQNGWRPGQPVPRSPAYRPVDDGP